ncbi:MAG: hypothetical protein K2W95_26950 [Candidatus Obscuribacterales bacterium]|nr:hypothetical protein [Candidatus Obscuribacterales bacterium]
MRHLIAFLILFTLALPLQAQDTVAPVADAVSEGDTAASGSSADGQTEGAVENVSEPVAPAPAIEQSNASSAPTFRGYTQFVDPSERSFSVEVPVGWKVEGRMSRASAIDCRPWVKVTSPDNLMCVFIGDDSIRPSTMPTSTLSALGFRVGSPYNGTQVLPYIPARKFLDKYVNLKLGSILSNLQVVSEGEHPDIALAVNGTVGATRSECASIKITADYGNIPASGYYIAATKATVQSGTGMWWVTYIAGSIGPADQDAVGLAVLLHMMQTFQMNPEWQQRAQQTTAAVSQNYRASANAMSKSIMDRYWTQQAANERFNQGYWNRQASQDRAANNFSDYMRDQQTVADPHTGERYKVDQANEHWIDPAGNITGTESGGQPGPYWRQLDNVR